MSGQASTDAWQANMSPHGGHIAVGASALSALLVAQLQHEGAAQTTAAWEAAEAGGEDGLGMLVQLLMRDAAHSSLDREASEASHGSWPRRRWDRERARRQGGGGTCVKLVSRDTSFLRHI